MSLVNSGRGWILTFLLTALWTPAPASEPDAVERGREALTLKGHLKPAWKTDVYRLVGKLWGDSAPDPTNEPEAYANAFNKRYGLHPAPYSNEGLPMGLKLGVFPDGKRSGVQIDCLLCHGGSIGGKSYVGLGNTQLDLNLLFDELARADGWRMPLRTFIINSSRGTNNAGMFSAVLLSLRNPDMSPRLIPLPLAVNLPEMDTPAWWLLHKKETMYYDGRTPAESVRTNMQFLLGEKSLSELKTLEPTFRDIRSYILSLRAPKYPFPIDEPRAQHGRKVFETNCKKCHGTYGASESYPNVVVELDEIKTDPARALGLSSKLIAHYNTTWLAEDHPADPVMVGYQAPPLDGIWATAPYLHNGSVPTLATLLNSSTRPSRFTRPPSTEFTHYDTVNVGWKFESVAPGRSVPVKDRGYLFDSSRFGLGNGGHTFGDKLSAEERTDLIEYLKTL
jgi:hypothetical protein